MFLNMLHITWLGRCSYDFECGAHFFDVEIACLDHVGSVDVDVANIAVDVDKLIINITNNILNVQREMSRVGSKASHVEHVASDGGKRLWIGCMNAALNEHMWLFDVDILHQA